MNSTFELRAIPGAVASLFWNGRHCIFPSLPVPRSPVAR